MNVSGNFRKRMIDTGCSAVSQCFAAFEAFYQGRCFGHLLRVLRKFLDYCITIINFTRSINAKHYRNVKKMRHWNYETGIMKHAEENERKRIKVDTRKCIFSKRGRKWCKRKVREVLEARIENKANRGCKEERRVRRVEI